MAKLSPRDRWLRYLTERIKALKLSGKIEPLRAKGLAVLHRKKQYTSEEWWQSFQQRAKSPEYLKWYEECEALADEFGLAPWVVVMMCLLKGYNPEENVGSMAMERDWPRIRVETDSTNPSFLRSLAHEAQRLGLYVVNRFHGMETTLLNLDVYENVRVNHRQQSGVLFHKLVTHCGHCLYQMGSLHHLPIHLCLYVCLSFAFCCVLALPFITIHLCLFPLTNSLDFLC